MKISRFRYVAALASTVALVVGCTAIGGRDEEPAPKRRGPIAIEIPQASTEPTEDEVCALQFGKVPCDEVRRLNKETERLRSAGYPPNCDAQCRKEWDQMLAWRPEAASDASAARGSCQTTRPKVVAKKKDMKPCSAINTALPASPASAARQSAPAIALLADPLMERQLSKEVGSYNGWNIFGYRDGFLFYRPYPMFGPNKAVFMRQQQRDFVYTCSKLRVPETDRDLRIKVTAAVNPSLLWEPDFHRLVSIYGAISGQHTDTNVVSAEDIFVGAKTYVGQHQEELCRLASTKSLDDVLRDPSLGAAGVLNRYFHRDARAHFEVVVQLTEVDLTKEDYRVIGLKVRTK